MERPALAAVRVPNLAVSRFQAIFGFLCSLRHLPHLSARIFSDRSGPSLKRHRVGDFSDVEVALSDALANGRASSDEQGPPRRKRRSTRPVSTTRAIPAAAKQAVRKSRGKPPRIAPEFQADVVPHPVLDAAMTTSESWVLSPCVFSPAMCGGNEIVTRFLDRINGEMVCRDGFPLTPVAMEIALVSLAGNKGRINAAITSALPQIPRGLFFPGAGKPWQHAETSLFVRALAERAKNFHYVSRHILTNRTTKELVITYYTYYKQQCYQNGGPKQGFIFDDGGRDASVGRTFLGQTRKVTALRNLAVTAGDGFPADQRMADAVLEFRNFSAVQARKKREEQNRRLSTGFQF